MKKIIRFSLVYPIIIYFGVLALLFFSQKTLVYYPSNMAFEECYNFEADEQKNYKNTRFYEKKGTNGNVIVFFHGNAGRACDRSFIKSKLEETGASLIFVEYHGYSDKNNTPSKKYILQDVENIGEYIQSKSEYTNIYLLGRSVGTGPASYYASKFKTDKLLLISPYSSLYKIGANKYPFFPIKYLFTENYSPEEYLINYTNDLLIIHGDQDQVVPLLLGQELFDQSTNPNKHISIIPQARHNDILGFEGVTEEIQAFFK